MLVQNNRIKAVGGVYETKILEFDTCLEKWLSSRGDNSETRAANTSRTR